MKNYLALFVMLLLLPFIATASDDVTILDKVSSLLKSAEGASATIAIILEFILRLVPTKKPLSIAYMAAKIATTIGALLIGFGKLLDKVLPQEIK